MASCAGSRGNVSVNSPVYQARLASERVRDRARYGAGEKATRKARYERQKVQSNPWDWRAKKIRNSCSNKSITGEWLERLWTQQNGRCALTGRPLQFDDMQLDHILPRARGGSDDFDNLRWVCSIANWAKNNLLDSELIELCRDLLREMDHG